MNTKKEMLRTRLAFDFRVMMEMARQSQLIEVQAFASQNHLTKRHLRIRHVSQGASAGYYLVHYNVRSLVGRGKYHTGFNVVFDLVTHKSYPKEHDDDAIAAGGISATCVSRPLPWSPHFLARSGVICLGSIWQGAQHTLLAHVVIHLARLLNWDERMETGYHGWNPEAVKWWRENLASKPITPGLRYPELPAELTHGTSHRKPKAAADFQVLNVTKVLTSQPVVKNRPKRIIRI